MSRTFPDVNGICRCESMHVIREINIPLLNYRPFHVGVASRLATAIYVAMVTSILYDNSYSLNDSNLKYESYRPYG